jgi:hypothetical protein
MTQRASASDNSHGRQWHDGKRQRSRVLSLPFSRPPCRAAVALALALLLVLAGCDQSAAQQPGAHPAATRPGVPAVHTAVPPTPTPTGLPAFSDWRAAYLSSDGFVHVVTLDGKTDLTSPALLHFQNNAQVFASAGASPDGHLLAYNTLNLWIVTMAGRGTVRDVFTRVVFNMAWSPDGRQLALNDASGGLSLLKTTGQELTPIPGLSINGDGQPLAGIANLSLWGWLDASHLAIGGYPVSGGSESATSYELRSLDVTSGAWRTIATISSPGLGAGRVALSSDGSRALFFNADLRDRPFTPIVDAIDTTTGAVTPLPAILRATHGTTQPVGPEYTSAAGRPGTHQLAVTTGFLPNHDLKVWLLDVDRDTATPLLNDQYVAQWSPDGATLVVSTSATTAAGLGPFDLSAVTFGPDGQPHVTLLTHFAMSFPFLGFVRTA